MMQPAGGAVAAIVRRRGDHDLEVTMARRTRRFHFGTISQPEGRMPSITLKGMPDDVYEALKARAQRNQRSLNGEILHILRGMTTGYRPPPTPEEIEALFASLDQLHARLRAQGFVFDPALVEDARHDGRP